MSDRARPEEPRAIAVVDIDGVLADVRHRLHHLDGRKDWGAFFRDAPKDPLLDLGYDTVKQLAAVFEVVYLSGRPEIAGVTPSAGSASTTCPRAS